MNKRDLCIFCTYFNFDLGCPDFSDVTPGDPVEIECMKGKWRMGQYEEDAQIKYRKKIRMAKDCPLFEMEKDDE